MAAKTYLTKSLLVLSAGLLAISTLLVLASPNQAKALSGSDFKPGRITDDTVFFDNNRMSVSSVQNFFNSKVPVCDTNGEKMYNSTTTRAEYGTSRGYPPPYTCLKDFSQSTSSKAKDEYCDAYAGGTKSAARILYDVAQSCGMNPQALIVLLQKEQALVSDDWPWSIQYRSATGYGCPDTAPCDSEYYGYFNQVYQAARAFKRYAAHPEWYNYRAQRYNTILWHPNSACGSSEVFIHNRATAGLYIYTPYRPNTAALNNLYGTGNGCSSYGNRNYWRMFNDWFGNTLTTTPYAWKLEEHAAYSDSSFTRKLDSSDVAPGNNIYIRLKARNMGNKTWDKSFLRLGTYRPTDRKSSFKDTSWLSEVRLASVQEDTVTPGGTGTFDFVLKTPTNPGTHKEHFNLVAESIAWLNDIRLFYQINSVEPATPKNTNNTLPTGSTIRKNEYILSSDLQSTLNLQTDGNLVLYRNFKPVWQSGTNGSKANRLTMQGDGNLVLYDEDNTPLWHTGTYSQPNSRLSLQTDGNLVLYNSSNTPTWHIGNTHNPHLLSVVNILLPKGKKLYPGQQLETADRKFRLTLQQDGNLVLYSTKRATWASVTAGKNVTHLSMQGDGNLVLYANKKAIWHTRTDRKGSSQLKVQQDGNLVIYNKHGQPTWHTKTHGVE